MTTPLEREILTHFHVCSAPYDTQGSSLRQDIIERFIAEGLLVRGAGGKVVGNDSALGVYMDALAAIPLPTQQWVIE